MTTVVLMVRVGLIDSGEWVRSLLSNKDALVEGLISPTQGEYEIRVFFLLSSRFVSGWLRRTRSPCLRVCKRRR